MQSVPHSNFKLNLTKFCIVRPLQTKRAAEVAFQLVDIFLLMGAPAFLQSDNGLEFTSRVITELKEMWPSLTMVPEKPRHPQSQGSVERIKCPPYSATFGCEVRVGLTSSPLPTEVVSRLESEDDLIEVMSGDDTTTTTGSAASSTGSKRRVEAYRGQVSQAERTVKHSRLDFKAGELGGNVAVPISAVGRGRGDPQNTLGAIVSRDLDNDQYKIAVKSGVLKAFADRINQVNAVSHREAVIAESACGGQAFTRCNCSGPKICSTNRCVSKLK
ncbi:uncharacterized protein LOC119583316 [Penaeus monodon]|uniref:uncharacterized protein LOC119583316 n=1 Tax=Penaeus monodon TaxID=6687 RepID=UPI0018A7BC09|nr:uncharacterized protein LOC119583316 [Penaeus monodon]